MLDIIIGYRKVQLPFNFINSLVAVVGFEQLSYTISETGMEQEVCVQVFNPPDNEDLAFNIFLAYETVPGTAGKLNFSVSCSIY